MNYQHPVTQNSRSNQGIRKVSQHTPNYLERNPHFFDLSLRFNS